MSIKGVNVPLFLIADSAYPLQTWLMKPFPQSSVVTNEIKQYNYRVSSARIIVENAYGRLKARWRRLMKRNDMHVDHIPQVIAAACILHNVCEIHREHVNDAWLQDISNSDYPHPTTVAIRDGSSNQPKRVRDGMPLYIISDTTDKHTMSLILLYTCICMYSLTHLYYS